MPSSPPSPKLAPQQGVEEKRRGRQRPGTACLECRSRKLKCDGSQPRCEKCVSSGGECIPTARMPRGPKRGYLRVLQNRIEMLEQRLGETQIQGLSDVEQTGFCPDDPFCNSVDGMFDLNDMYMPPDLFQSGGGMPTGPINVHPSPITPSTTGDTGNSSPMHTMQLTDSLDPSMECILSDDLLRTDLNQLYFERVQLSVPILHRATYFTWARSPAKTEAQVSLQYAMWTLAASLSSQFQDVRDTLYRFTLLSLEVFESKDETLSSIEHVQARLLICIYELMRKNHQRAWMSAGRCFRLLQLMRLHDIDGADAASRRSRAAADADGWIRLEERRRTFWVAYALDMLISVRGSWLSTLHDLSISTRLPVPEDDFQNGTYVEMPCLTDPAQALDAAQRSPLGEFIALASVMRLLAVHRRRTAAAGDQPDRAATQSFWSRHRRLDETVAARATMLLQKLPATLCRSDPLLLLTGMMLHAVALCLCEVMDAAGCDAQPEHQAAAGAFRHRSLQVVRTIVGLSRSLTQLSYLKIHPLTPLPLCICVEFLDEHRYLDDSSTSHLQEIYDALREMSSVNSLAQDFLAEQSLPT